MKQTNAPRIPKNTKTPHLIISLGKASKITQGGGASNAEMGQRPNRGHHIRWHK